MKLTFNKKERLCDKKRIQDIFNHGKKKNQNFLTLFYNTNSTNDTILIKVPKKCIKEATKRNKIKRRIREVWRINKPLFLNKQNTYDMILMYKKNDIVPYKEIERNVLKIMKSICIVAEENTCNAIKK